MNDSEEDATVEGPKGDGDGALGGQWGNGDHLWMTHEEMEIQQEGECQLLKLGESSINRHCGFLGCTARPKCSKNLASHFGVTASSNMLFIISAWVIRVDGCSWMPLVPLVHVAVMGVYPRWCVEKNPNC